MSKMSEMDATIKELRDVASSINDIANWLTSAFSGDQEPQLTFEEVRTMLSKRSRKGLKDQIRELLLSHGANKLSELDASHYNQIASEARALMSDEEADREEGEDG